jgi:hypothetical protein
MRWLHLVARVAPVLAVAALAAPASATTLIRQGLDELVRGNATIVQGKVVDLHSYWNQDHTFILTDVRVRPVDGFKSWRSGKDVTFTILGGMVGDVTTMIVGGPVLVPGTEYLLFLNHEDLPGAAQALTVRDLVQGVYEVGVVNGQRRFFSQALGHPLAPDAQGRFDVPGGEAGIEATDMVTQIRKAIDEQ